MMENEKMKKLVERLHQTSELLEKDGLQIDVRDIPDGDGIHRIDPRTLAFNQSRIANDGGKTVPPTVEQMRKRSYFNYNLNRAEIITKYIEVPSEYGNVPVWVHYPRFMEGEQPGYICVHGGAFITGSALMIENQCRLIAERANCVVFNIEYTRSPEVAYPVALTQVYAVLGYVYENAEAYRVIKEKIVIQGDSSAGNLVAACMQMDRDNATYYARAHVLIYPATTLDNHNLIGYNRDFSDLTVYDDEKELLPYLLRIGSDPYKVNNERVYVQGKESVQHPYISPAFGKAEGLPEALIFLAEYDGLRLEGEYYARKLKKAGVDVKVIMFRGSCHGFFGGLGIQPQAEASIDEIAAFVEHLS